MLRDHIASQIYANFNFEPTVAQKKIVHGIADWLTGDDHEKILILNGYAGTGKTSVIAATVAALNTMRVKSVVLAPTGRAAKVAAQYTGGKTYTIHKKIYRRKSASDPDSGFALDFNKESDTVFIVDEGSMIPDERGGSGLFGSGTLLDDLVRFVRGGRRCRLMIVGDDAQLPPVGHDRSPALDAGVMSRYGGVDYHILDQVVRQDGGSGILFNATLVRCMIEAGIYRPPMFRMSFPDFRAVEGGELMEAIEDCYCKYGRENTIVVTRSNRRAIKFNEGIRRNVLYAEEELETGDMLMVVKNNYSHVTGEDESSDFIANGDTARLCRLRRVEQLYGFRFAEAVLRFPDYRDMELDCRILRTLHFNDCSRQHPDRPHIHRN